MGAYQRMEKISGFTFFQTASILLDGAFKNIKDSLRRNVSQVLFLLFFRSLLKYSVGRHFFGDLFTTQCIFKILFNGEKFDID